MKSKIVALFVCVVLLLTGCGSSSSDDITIVKKTPAPRMKEESVSLPEEMVSQIEGNEYDYQEGETFVTAFGNAKGQLEVLSKKYDSSQVGDSMSELYMRNVLVDKGDWNRVKCKFAEQLTDSEISSFQAYDVDETMGLLYAVSVQYDPADAKKTNCYLYTMDMMSDSVTKKKIKGLLGDAFENAYSTQAQLDVCAEDNTAMIYVSSRDTATMQIRVYNIETGAKVLDAPEMSEAFCMDSSFLYITKGSEVLKYDKTNGKEEAKIKLEDAFSGDCKMTIGSDGALYMVNHNGVYRAEEGATKFDQLFSGANSKYLSNDETSIRGIYPVSDSCVYAYYLSAEKDENQNKVIKVRMAKYE